MSQNDFLSRLKKLPPDTPLTAVHVAAILESLASSLEKKSEVDFDALSNSKLIDEETLAEWLGESSSTLQKWRVKGGGPHYVRSPKSVRYAVGAVRDWIESHTVTSTSEAHVKGLSRFEGLGDGISELEPIMVIDTHYVGFFRSLQCPSEVEPTGFILPRIVSLTVLHAPVLPKNLTPEEQQLANQLLEELDTFRQKIIASSKKVKSKKGEVKPEISQPNGNWINQLSESQRFGYFETVLAFDLDYAVEIATGFSEHYLRENFNPAKWLWKLLVEFGETALSRDNLLFQFQYLQNQGVDINRPVKITDHSGKEIFQGTIAHLLADTNGKAFHLHGAVGDLQHYSSMLLGLFRIGLSVESLHTNEAVKSAVDIATNIDEDMGVPSPFTSVCQSFQLHEKLQNNLQKKSFVKAGNKPVFKI